jgi:hypothetical protein
MPSIKYGCITPAVESVEMPVAASQKFKHDSANFVVLDNDGNIRLALTADATLYGYAIIPKGRGAGDDDGVWESSSTAGKDKILVVKDPDARYLIPASSPITQSNVGNAYDLIGVNDGTAQIVNLAAGNNDVVVIEKPGTSIERGVANDAVVRINYSKFQSD